MRVRRLLGMGISELAGRGRQEAWKWWDRLGAARRGAYVPGRGPRHRVSEPMVARVRAQLAARFFEGAGAAAFLLERIPEVSAPMVAAAEALCRGQFDLLGYRGLVFGDPVDWHLDPVSRRRAPLVHWSRLNPLDPARVGDSKVVWELNRHQWLLWLGQAYRLTGDERYADTFAGYVRDWLRANPPGMGINWASSLEVALRLMAWCWALVLFEGSRALSPDLFGEMLGGIRAHARHVERYLSHYFSPNTHLTGEALGLFYAGVLFPELPRARRWREQGARILVGECARQVLPDGVYFEQSTCYQRYTAEIYLQFLILGARVGMTVPTAVGERVQRLLDCLLALRRPDGSMPQIGDADGGWLLPLVPRAPDDLRGVFGVAAPFWGRSDYAWAADGLAPEALWLLGPAGAKAFEALTPAPPERVPSQLFADGGYVVMRSGWEADAHQMIFDVGPLGAVSGGHGHADLLSLQCAIFGQPVLVDPGTYCYTPHPEWRDFFRSTAAHSTVRVDGEEQAVPAGPFAWKALPRARLRRWLSTEAFDLADAEYDAYRRLSDPVRHRRRVLFVKPRYWVVVDDLEGAAEHRVELGFQFGPMEVTVAPDLWARARGSGGRGLLIRPFAAVPLKAELYEGELAPARGWVSPDYGQRRPAPLLIYSAVTRLPFRIVTLLLPAADPLAPLPVVSPLGADSSGPAGLVFEDLRESIRFGESEFVVERR